MSRYVDPVDDRHVSFPSDDAPEREATRIHILGADDYYLAVATGERWPMQEAFRACTSGARDPAVTWLLAALWKYGRGDLEGARVCARLFHDNIEDAAAFAADHRPLEKSPAEQALDEIAALCGCPKWDYPAQVVRDVQAKLGVLEQSTAALERICATLDGQVLPGIERILGRLKEEEGKSG